jgi:ribosome biogenesis SPOUT family RNA methylase Rps3
MVVVMARLLLLLIVGLMGDSHYRDRSEEEIKEKLDAIIKRLNERERSD